MSNITQYDPFNDLLRLDPFVDLDDVLRAPRARALWRNMPQEPHIKMDVSEDEKAYRIKAEVPGVSKEDIKVSIDGNQVYISAEVKREKEEKKGETVIRSERYYGKQSRGFTLKHDFDQGKAEAKYENGILELTIPKKEVTTATQLSIK
jgi:HSP20 family protein